VDRFLLNQQLRGNSFGFEGVWDVAAISLFMLVMGA
jgi:hypothetical protein